MHQNSYQILNATFCGSYIFHFYIVFLFSVPSYTQEKVNIPKAKPRTRLHTSHVTHSIIKFQLSKVQYSKV